MRLFVGLGNPGSRYAKNRHNVGFMALEAIANRHAFAPFKARAKFEGEIAEGELGNERVIALKPPTYVNESGRAVAALGRFHRIVPEHMIVFYDELDLAPGKVRVKRNGGNAGHNGLESIDEHIGKDYWRVRIGIGHPGARELVTPYVLSNFFADDRAWLEATLSAIAAHAALLATGDPNRFMTNVARATAEVRQAGENDEPGDGP